MSEIQGQQTKHDHQSCVHTNILFCLANVSNSLTVHHISIDRKPYSINNFYTPLLERGVFGTLCDIVTVMISARR